MTKQQLNYLHQRMRKFMRSQGLPAMSKSELQGYVDLVYEGPVPDVNIHAFSEMLIRQTATTLEELRGKTELDRDLLMNFINMEE